MAQLCVWIKTRTKQWLILGVSVFQCMRAGFLWPKCDNFACLYTRQNQNELHLKRWFFFCQNRHLLSVDLSQYFPALFKRMPYIPYSFGGRIKLIICQIRHELSVTIQEISTSWKKNVKWWTLCMCSLILVCPFFPHACCYWFTWIVFDIFVSVYCVHVVYCMFAYIYLMLMLLVVYS